MTTWERKIRSRSPRDLSSDILLELFAEFPINFLRSLKCVSKRWKFVIETNSEFLERMQPPLELDIVDSNNAPGNLHVYSVNQDGFATHLESHQLNANNKDDGSWRNISFCNGLVCGDGVVYNLTTKTKIEYRSLYSSCRSVRGIGYDPSSNKYKVLTTSSSRYTVHTLGSVHSPKEEVFNRTGVKCDKDSIGDSVATNGRIYWLDLKKYCIWSFAFKDENFSLVHLPTQMTRTVDSKCSLLEYKGSLCLVQIRASKDINIWLLRNGSWIPVIKNATLPVEGTGLGDYICNKDKDFHMLSRGSEIVVVTRDHKDQYMFLYSFLNGQFRRVKITGIPFFPTSIHNHVENNVTLKSRPPYFWE